MADIVFTDTGKCVRIEFNSKATKYGDEVVDLPYNSTCVHIIDGVNQIRFMAAGAWMNVDYADVETPASVDVNDLLDQLQDFFFDLSAGVEEAPVDAKTYGRKDAAWVEVTGGGGGGSQYKMGNYLGDGTTANGVTGVGFLPDYILVWEKETADAANVNKFWTTLEMINDHVDGMAIFEDNRNCESKAGRIKSLDADGFTVGDGGTSEHPNKPGTTYYYIAQKI